jgi:hypothetical protein
MVIVSRSLGRRSDLVASATVTIAAKIAESLSDTDRYPEFRPVFTKPVHLPVKPAKRSLTASEGSQPKFKLTRWPLFVQVESHLNTAAFQRTYAVIWRVTHGHRAVWELFETLRAPPVRSWLLQKVRKNELPKPNKINVRSYSIRKFLKLWVERISNCGGQLRKTNGNRGPRGGVREIES